MKTFTIAEMACSHEGEVALAERIIDAAGAADADAVQLQIWGVEHMMAPQRKEYELLQRIELTQDQWAHLVRYSRERYTDMQVYVCVYEHASIGFIDALEIDGYKLNSSDLSNPLVLQKVAATGKPINLSVGASSIAEIQSALERIRAVAGPEAATTLMYGHQSFPTRPENVHMAYMEKLQSLFELPVGYQDHCDADSEAAFWLPAASVGMGVTVLEKHLTHDRSLKGIDHESALNPDEFQRFVAMVRTLDAAKGDPRPRPFTPEEVKYREFQKKSIVASRDIVMGTVLTEDDIVFMRAEELGISPDRYETVIGRTTTQAIEAYRPLLEKDLS